VADTNTMSWAPPREDRLQAGAGLLLAGAIVFAPLAFGGTEAWAQQVLIVAVAAALGLLAVHQALDPAGRVTRSWTYVPILGFIALAVVQVMPLPTSLVDLVSPQTIALRERLLADLPEAERLASTTPISFYPHATVVQLRQLLLAVGVFVLVLNLVRRRDQMSRLLWALVVAGAATVLIAGYQHLVGGQTIFDAGGHKHAGPFLNYGHFAQFVNLSIGAALALMLLDGAVIQKERIDATMLWKAPETRGMRWRLLGLGTYVILAAVAVVMSLSRGGVVAMLAAGVLAGGYFAWRTGPRSPASGLAILALLAFGVLLAVGFELVYDRLATLGDLDRASGGRWDILAGLVPAFADFAVVGTGLGTFAYIYPLYATETVAQVTTHAENEYAQLMLETGVVGVALAGVFLALVLRRLLQATWKPRRRESWAAYGLTFAILAVLIHSFTDFGQHTPAVAVATAVVFALTCRVGRAVVVSPRASSAMSSDARRAAWTQRWVRVAAVAVVLAVSGWTVASADAARRAEARAVDAGRLAERLSPTLPDATDEQMVELLAVAGEAAELQPRNAESKYALNVYRWWTLSRAVDPDTGELVLLPEEVEFTKRIIGELHAVRAACPPHGGANLLAGQLLLEVLDQEAGRTLIARGQELSPHDPLATMYAAREAIAAGDTAAAERLLLRAAALDHGLRDRVVRSLVADLDRPQAAYELAKGNRGSLLRFASLVEGDATHGPLAVAARDEARRLLRAEASADNASAGALASLGETLAKEGNHAEAIGYLRRAVALDYAEVRWRVQLAESLAAAGELEAALHEARMCLRLRPGLDRAERLVDHLAGRVEEGRSRS